MPVENEDRQVGQRLFGALLRSSVPPLAMSVPGGAARPSAQACTMGPAQVARYVNYVVRHSRVIEEKIKVRATTLVAPVLSPLP